jgi:flagellar hook assembly protein FlgD
LFIDVNEIRPGGVANITLIPGLRGTIRLKIYNSAGELVRTLEAQYPATEKEVISRKWDATNKYGDFVSSGVYVVWASMPGIVKTGRVIVLR